MSPSLRRLYAGTVLSLLALASTQCELLVDLDRGQVDGAIPEGCPICTNLAEAGDDEDAGESTGEASAESADATTEGGNADGMSDATTDSAPDGSPTDAGGQDSSTDSSGE